MNQDNHKIIELDTTLKQTPGVETEIQSLFMARRVLRTEPLSQSWQLKDKFLQFSQGAEVYNQLVVAIHAAYQHHIPLALSPDHLWLQIMQTTAIHINQNAEKLRSKFVDFDGKKQLTIERLETDLTKLDWDKIVEEFSIQMKSYIGQELHQKLVPQFSTTTIITHTAYGIALMDALQSYFDFMLCGGCGIPKVKLMGTLEDWQKLRKLTESLIEFDLDWWVPHILPVIDKLIEAHKGKVDKVFWNDIYQYRAGKPSGGELSTATGWITLFFPYKKSFNNWERRDNLKLPLEIFPSNVQGGICKAPVKFMNLINGEEKQLYFKSGFIGVIRDQDGYLNTKIGWAIVEEQIRQPIIVKK